MNDGMARGASAEKCRLGSGVPPTWFYLAKAPAQYHPLLNELFADYEPGGSGDERYHPMFSPCSGAQPE